MKFLLPCLLTLLPWVGSSQSNDHQHLVFLKNGSVLRGNILETSDAATIHVQLTDGPIVEVPRESVIRQKNLRSRHLIFPDGRAAIEKGRYHSINLNYLAGRYRTSEEQNIRRAWGAHFSTGYHFNQWLAIGGGIGLDFHEYAFAPVFLELSGFVDNKNKPVHKNQRPQHDGPDFSKKPGRTIPFFYSLQIGYNAPLHGIFGSGDFGLNVVGGSLIYPSAGFLFPSRFGHTFRLDFGYKFQTYNINQANWWWTSQVISDTITLRSLALRAGWVF